MLRRWLAPVLVGFGCIGHGPEPLELDPPPDAEPAGMPYSISPDREPPREDLEPAPAGCQLRAVAIVHRLYHDRDEAIAAATDMTPGPDDALSIDALSRGEFQPWMKLPEFARSYDDFTVARNEDSGTIALISQRKIVGIQPGQDPDEVAWPGKVHRRITSRAAHFDPSGRLWLAYVEGQISRIATIDAEDLGHQPPTTVPVLTADERGEPRSRGWRFARQRTSSDHVFVAWSDITEEPRNTMMRVARIDTSATTPQATILPNVPGASASPALLDAFESDDGLYVLWAKWPKKRRKKAPREVRVSRWDGTQWTELVDDDPPTSESPYEASLIVTPQGELMYTTIQANASIHHSRRPYTVVVRTWEDETWQAESMSFDPPRNYKNAPHLLVHEGVVHLAYITETPGEVYSASDIGFRMIREGQTAKLASTPTTQARNMRLLARRGARWVDAVGGEGALPEEGDRFELHLMGCP